MPRTSPQRFISSLVLLLAAVSPTLAAPVESVRLGVVGGLSFDERVACQTAIERVYWNNRLWPQENPAPKPSFEAVFAPAEFLTRAEDALLKSRALEATWQRSIDPGALQAELDRLVRDTRRPGVLGEIFSALGDDPARIGECLARPLLADRLLREWYASDDRLHAEARALAEGDLERFGQADLLRWTTGNYSELRVDRDGGERKSPTEDARRFEAHKIWSDTREWLADLYGRNEESPAMPQATALDRAGPKVAAAVGLPLKLVSRLQETRDRFYVVAVLEQREDVLEIALAEWPKLPFEQWWSETRSTLGPPRRVAPHHYRLDAPLDAGCALDTWQPTVAPIVEANWSTAIWTGSEMLVWGGFPYRDDRANYGGHYDPATDTWQLISTWNAPSSRGRHTAVWTGTEMIVWGGEAEGLDVSNTGSRYNPTTKAWVSTSTTGAPAPRSFQAAVWTGTEMVVWGGCTDAFCNVLPGTGGRYSPSSDTWQSVATSGAPNGRYGHTAVWTGAEMVVWGGWTGSEVEATGGVYDPATDSWIDTNLAGAPPGRFFHSAVWADDRMIIWGGREGEFSTVYFADGGRYDPLGDGWTPTQTAGAPSARDGHRAVWTGSEMILFGGYDGDDEVNTGGRYDPLLDSWTATTTVNAPDARTIPTMVWTGTEMIAWSGIGATGGGLADGARYDPASDSWVPVGKPATPSERSFHTQISTGTEVVVWGGCGIFADDICPTDTGGRFDVVTDTWTPTSVAGAPLRREFHNAVWTGTEVMIWGGCPDIFCFSRLDTGGRYNPATDSWTAMTTVGVPQTRYWHDGVWTGTEMIVWGGCHNKDCTNTSPPLPEDGGRYDPATDSWTPTTLVGAPGGRWFTTTTWTGSEMVVWGGQDMDVGRLDDGARYDPATDSWTPTSTLGAPTPRVRHRSHWTGDRLLVWGGDDFFGVFYDSGGAYDPVSDVWTATTTANAPSGRAYPYTAWTGDQLVVWSGLNNGSPDPNDGGLYDPQADTWQPLTLAEAPQGRADLYTGAWTGSELFVFGGADVTLMEAETGGLYCAGATVPVGIFADGFESGDTSAWSAVTN